MKIRITVIMLLAVLLLVSCGGREGNTPLASDKTPAETEPEAPFPPMSELKNFEGRTFTFLTRDAPFLNEFTVDEITGDTEDDAVYRRNLATEEKYNCKFVFDAHPDGWAEHEIYDALIHDSVLAGDGLFDALTSYQCCLAYNVAWGDLLDLRALPYFDFSAKWWSEPMVNGLSANGRLFYAGGDIVKSAIRGICCIFFNKTLAEDYKLTTIYDLVRKKKWTHDKMAELVRGTYQDVNGDGAKDAGDVYGYTPTDYTIRNYVVAYDTPIFGADNSGKLKLVWNTEHTYSVVEKLVTLTQMEDVQYNIGDAVFTEGRSLFHGVQLSYAKSWRGMDIDFGILPFPMFDEDQGRYLSSVANSSSMIAVMITAKSPEDSAYILEAMCRESMTTIRPAVFEVSLKAKYARDEDSTEMVDYVRDSMSFDIGWANSLILGTSGTAYSNMVSTGNIDFASWYASQENSFLAKLAEFSKPYYD